MPEHQTIEWKESWHDEYLEWICGYANAYGGTLYIGKNDNGDIVGLDRKKTKALLESIPCKITDTMGIVADVNLLCDGEIEYIEIIVDKYPSLISYHGKYYYRSGSTMRTITGKELDKAILKSQGKTWDGMPIIKLKPEDLRKESIDLFKEKSIQRNRLTKDDVNVSDDVLLENLRLYDEEGYLIRAAMLAFYKDPEKWVTGAYIRIGFFGDNDSDLLYQDEVHGSLIEQIDKTVELVYLKYLKAYIYYDGIQRVEQYMFHKDAFREILLNAVVHKDYSSCNPIQISVYKDKMYIWNDGEFPEDLQTMEQLFDKHSSKPFNPKLAYVFFMSGMIEAWGRGFDKIKRGCDTLNSELPEYKISERGVMVKCKPCPKYMELLNMDTQIKPILEQAGQAEQAVINAILAFCREPRSLKEIMEHMGETNRSNFKRDYFDKLVDKKVLGMTLPNKPTSPKQKYYSL